VVHERVVRRLWDKEIDVRTFTTGDGEGCLKRRNGHHRGQASWAMAIRVQTELSYVDDLRVSLRNGAAGIA
jgi:hypothetical protein